MLPSVIVEVVPRRWQRWEADAIINDHIPPNNRIAGHKQ